MAKAALLLLLAAAPAEAFFGRFGKQRTVGNADVADESCPHVGVSALDTALYAAHSQGDYTKQSNLQVDDTKFQCMTNIPGASAEETLATLHYGFDDNQQVLHLAIEADVGENGWLSLAFPTLRGMAPADAVVAYAPTAGEEHKVETMAINGLARFLMAPDDQQLLSSGFKKQPDGRSLLWFSRNLANGGRVVIDPDSTLTINYAFGTGADIAYHGPRGRGSVRVPIRRVVVKALDEQLELLGVTEAKAAEPESDSEPAAMAEAEPAAMAEAEPAAMAEAEAEPTAGGVADELEAAAALEAEVQPTDEVSSEVASILEAVDAIALAPATEEVTEEVEIEYTGLCPSVESRIRTNEDAADAMKNAAITRRQQMRSERASQSEINSRIVHEIALLRDLLDIGEDPSFVSAVSTATRVAAEQSQPEFDDYYEYDEPLVTAMSGPSAWAKPALGATMSRDAPKGFDQNLLLDQQLNALAGSYAKKLRPESAPGTRRRMLQDEACCPSLLPRLDAIEMRLESMRKLRSRDNADDDDTDTNQADINRRIVAELGH